MKYNKLKLEKDQYVIAHSDGVVYMKPEDEEGIIAKGSIISSKHTLESFDTWKKCQNRIKKIEKA